MTEHQIPAEEYRVQAFDLGLQYLVAGRFATASWCMPVAANLLHHAIEMFLKGCLVEAVGFSGLPRGRNGHDLRALWRLCLEQFSGENLDRFTDTIGDLDRFEQIRYPETLIRHGALIGIGFPSGARHVQLQGQKTPEYQVSVDDIDALVGALFKVGRVNPAFYSMRFDQEHAKKYFEFRNRIPLREPETEH